MILNTIEIEGTLQSDGRLILDEKPDLPAGRVRVALQALSNGRAVGERLPDIPTVDESISAPFDLPYFGDVVQVTPRSVEVRVPEFPQGRAEDAP